VRQAFDFNSDQCENCAAGYYSPQAGALECLPCLEGFFSPREGASSCLSCDIIKGAEFYQDSRASADCKSCPLNMERQRGLPGLNISECDCAVDSYRQGDQEDAYERGGCLDCPEGAVCDGLGALPYPMPGWYSEPRLAREEVRPKVQVSERELRLSAHLTP
jgi:hypothetical protein